MSGLNVGFKCVVYKENKPPHFSYPVRKAYNEALEDARKLQSHTDKFEIQEVWYKD
jgi:hypothetical protein